MSLKFRLSIIDTGKGYELVCKEIDNGLGVNTGLTTVLGKYPNPDICSKALTAIKDSLSPELFKVTNSICSRGCFVSIDIESINLIPLSILE